jgi:3-oxoacyl-[acyl-carrier-protein] synthase-1/3-oxoacyl-[acyl-carrier-protein] synthase II
LNAAGIFITSMGIISPIGCGTHDTIEAIRNATPGIKPLRLFPTAHRAPLPVGEIRSLSCIEDVPRTHTLARIAAEEAMKDALNAPDAVVIGVTTGGMPVTEELLKKGISDPEHYKYHSTGSVAAYVARYVGCKGPVLTVSTACSSGAVALKIALEMLRRGKAKQILAGGVDALCKLTYYGFHSLQLVDETGAHPFDRKRRGMSVGEGAAMLLLTVAESPPENALAEFLGAGLSCDAYHPAAPHPMGEGALQAMKRALSDACISPADIDYIHLHGTGTVDNDLAEARAIHTLFRDRPIPPLSSQKGAIGHSLAAAGAIGAVVSAISITNGVVPANTGFREPDPLLNLIPPVEPLQANVTTVLSNSFGFGGNNATIVLGHPQRRKSFLPSIRPVRVLPLAVLGSACLTGAGTAEGTMECLGKGEGARGIVPSHEILKPLSEKYVRRLKRLCRMVLSLAVSACEDTAKTEPPSAVYFGTGWGGMSETYDFLTKLNASDEQFTSPTDFIGSVHNAAAGHVAIRFKSTGPNVTTTGGDCSFEHALYSASLLSCGSNAPLLVIGADEHHDTLSPLFDASIAPGRLPADGGGALLLRPATPESPLQICPSFVAYCGENGNIVPELINTLGGAKRINDQFGAILVGIPAAQREKGEAQLNAFMSMTGYPHPVIDYRQFVGEFASASAVAAVLAVSFAHSGEIPANISSPRPVSLRGLGVLLLGFGNHMTAVEITP